MNSKNKIVLKFVIVSIIVAVIILSIALIPVILFGWDRHIRSYPYLNNESEIVGVQIAYFNSSDSGKFSDISYNVEKEIKPNEISTFIEDFNNILFEIPKVMLWNLEYPYGYHILIDYQNGDQEIICYRVQFYVYNGGSLLNGEYKTCHYLCDENDFNNFINKYIEAI